MHLVEEVYYISTDSYLLKNTDSLFLPNVRPAERQTDGQNDGTMDRQINPRAFENDGFHKFRR